MTEVRQTGKVMKITIIELMSLGGENNMGRKTNSN